MLLLLVACTAPKGPDTQDTGTPAADPAFVWEPESHEATQTDEDFPHEVPQQFRTTNIAPDLDIRALTPGSGGVWVGTGSGVYLLTETTATPLVGAEGVVADLALDGGGGVIAAVDDRVFHVSIEGSTGQWTLPSTVHAVSWSATGILAVTDDGLWTVEGTPTLLTSGPVTSLAVDGDQSVWLGSATGLRAVHIGGGVVAEEADWTAALPDPDVHALSALSGHGVLAGGGSWLAWVGSDNDHVFRPEPGSLPAGDITSLAAVGAVAAIGHPTGATFLGGHKDHYHGQRWLPSDTVRAVAISSDDTRWIGTDAGVTRVTFENLTLADTAAAFDAMTDDFWRLDFVADEGWRADAWDETSAWSLSDFDNDGLWTEMNIATWSYAAGATGDPAWCERAARAAGMMYRLIDIPGESFTAAGLPTGFVARSLVRDDEGALFTDKATQPNWHLVQGYEGHDWYWKDDTSSDETTGHFFGLPLYYDLCADEAERAVVADHLGRLAGAIVDGGYQLIDLDGERTTWGYWDPDHLNIALDGLDVCLEQWPVEDCLGAAYGAGWLQSIEILGHLLAAWHVTGDTRFLDAYEHLVTEERYAELVDFNEDILTVTNPSLANFSDHELAMLAYHTLIRYEPDDDRRARWIASRDAFYAHEVGTRNPLWAMVVAAGSPSGYDLPSAVDTLRAWPADWREWLADNSHRADYVVGGTDRFDEPQFTEVPPYDEIRTMQWNGNPYVVVGGGDGRAVQSPWPWLLPYWMGRYHGVIGAP